MLAVADYPKLVRDAVSEAYGMLTPTPEPQLLPDRFPSKSGFLPEKGYHDSGYLLFSGLDSERNEHTVKLIELSSGDTVHQWFLHYDEIFADTPVDGGSYKLFSKDRLRMQHPLLDADGSIVFNTQDGPLVKIDACSRHIWTNNTHFHHSIEFDGNHDIWATAVTYPPSADTTIMGGRYRDDALARLNTDGEILELRSLTSIMIQNGYRGLLYGIRDFGTTNQKHPIDLFHLNDITPALYDGRFWKKGDLLLSMRNLSSVALYRPSTNRILWIKTGPWLNQHDVNFLGDSKITVFGNDHIRGLDIYNKDNISEIYIFDLQSGEISTPYTKQLIELAIRSPTEGRSRVMDDGGVFIAESNFGRLVKLSEKGLQWSYVNRYGPNEVGKISWCRYLTADEVREAIAHLGSVDCR
jgi:hypothetical protein